MIATVVLAAGRSERFGSPKLLAEWWGRPLVEHALTIAPAEGVKVAVLGSATTKLRPLVLAHGFQCIRNARPARGQSSSLRLALDAMPPQVEAVLVLLGDAAAVPAPVVERVLTAYRTADRAVSAAYDGRTAPPVVIPRSDWDRIPAEGDKPGEDLDPLPVDVTDLIAGGEDVDTPDDLFALAARRAGVTLLEPAMVEEVKSRLGDPAPFAVRLRRRSSANDSRPAISPQRLSADAIEHGRGCAVIARVGDEYAALLG